MEAHRGARAAAGAPRRGRARARRRSETRACTSSRRLSSRPCGDRLVVVVVVVVVVVFFVTVRAPPLPFGACCVGVGCGVGFRAAVAFGGSEVAPAAWRGGRRRPRRRRAPPPTRGLPPPSTGGAPRARSAAAARRRPPERTASRPSSAELRCVITGSCGSCEIVSPTMRTSKGHSLGTIFISVGAGAARPTAHRQLRAAARAALRLLLRRLRRRRPRPRRPRARSLLHARERRLGRRRRRPRRLWRRFAPRRPLHAEPPLLLREARLVAGQGVVLVLQLALPQLARRHHAEVDRRDDRADQQERRWRSTAMADRRGRRRGWWWRRRRRR